MAVVAVLSGAVHASAVTALSPIDRACLITEASGAAYELASAKLAAAKATREDVKAYARMLVGDHEAYNAALLNLGKAKGLLLPTEVDGDDAKRLSALDQASGPGFDAAYVTEALRVNAEDGREAEQERASTADPAIKAFIERFAGRGVDAKHEAGAKRLGGRT